MTFNGLSLSTLIQSMWEKRVNVSFVSETFCKIFFESRRSAHQNQRLNFRKNTKNHVRHHPFSNGAIRRWNCMLKSATVCYEDNVHSHSSHCPVVASTHFQGGSRCFTSWINFWSGRCCDCWESSSPTLIQMNVTFTFSCRGLDKSYCSLPAHLDK